MDRLVTLVKQFIFFRPSTRIINIKQGMNSKLTFTIPSMLFKKVMKDSIAIMKAPKKYGKPYSWEKYAAKPATITIKDIKRKMLIILHKTLVIKLDFPKSFSINSP